MSDYNYNLTSFLTSAPTIHHLPDDVGTEIAFIGYSNSGKSSALNALTNQKKLARTSKIPGCTQLINLFQITEGYRLVDLPGYGYAKIPKKMKIKWNNTLTQYLRFRNCLQGLLILMDIRYPLKDLDKKIISWAQKNKLQTLILLTKSDKLSTTACHAKLITVRQEIKNSRDVIQVELFSSKKNIGIHILRNKMDSWYLNPDHIQNNRSIPLTLI
ncbi:Probable GTP-binding protein EngB [Candidatus Erwinia haradaeae]|uniref:Probable GTP-binding protein EngB n=1 Tax=Candidatus Erwinia haradaeae TaxID=1922217 RepID=A0A451CZL8_9GAMM|nr:ribosome biogenesis GTP-binding protein YihA/YsxC [Candidatus Erwinia haradaeae]VFP78469.1 Probable GTP-binding protein EngB [Candidatus Erwinia haradaeae]